MTFAASGQATTGAEPSPSVVLRPALAEVQSTTANLNISRWKASGGIRRATQDDVGSIQRDLSQTLPGLLASADAAPESVPASFAAYRNVDALYDVLLRISAVANLAAPGDEADAIASSLQHLESARAKLGDAILHASQLRDAQMREFEAAIRAARAAQAAPKKETVIEDGPARASERRRSEKKVVHRHHVKEPAKKPASATTNDGAKQ